MNAYDSLELDLRAALARRYGHRRRVRATFVAAAVTALASGAVAVASTGLSIADLDPMKWTILHRGTVDRGEYVHARNNDDGGESLFLEEHDDGLAPYAVFLLHERNVDKAVAESGDRYLAEDGPLCTPEQLTEAERVALQGGDAQGSGARCRGLRWAQERADWVKAGKEPASALMPGARAR